MAIRRDPPSLAKERLSFNTEQLDYKPFTGKPGLISLFPVTQQETLETLNEKEEFLDPGNGDSVTYIQVQGQALCLTSMKHIQRLFKQRAEPL